MMTVRLRGNAMGVSPTMTICASTMEEAIAKARKELGPDAVVLSSRRLKRRGLGLRKGELEVTAASATTPTSTNESSPKPSLHDQLLTLTRMIEELHQWRELDTEPDWQPLVNELRQLELPDEWIRDATAELRDRGIRAGGLRDQAIANELIGIFADRFAVDPSLDKRGGQSRVVAVVGTTGVGKTTTVAKLAANAALEGLQVALLTVDYRRIGAAEQLQAYARVLGAPFQVVGSPRRLREVMATMGGVDRFFIDTPGINPGESSETEELASFLGQDVESHLLIDPNVRESRLMAILAHFQRLDIQRVMMSKLDECVAGGLVACAARHSRGPISFLTTGQNVPDDILPGNRIWMARFALGLASAAREKGSVSATSLPLR
jgi:flagellar biosynthesis protein FlhF